MCPCELAHALLLRRTELCLEGDVGMSASLDFAGMKQSFQQRQKAKGDTFCCGSVWRQVSTAALVFEGKQFQFPRMSLRELGWGGPSAQPRGTGWSREQGT